MTRPHPEIYALYRWNTDPHMECLKAALTGFDKSLGPFPLQKAAKRRPVSLTFIGLETRSGICTAETLQQAVNICHHDVFLLRINYHREMTVIVNDRMFGTWFCNPLDFMSACLYGQSHVVQCQYFD